MKLLSNFLVACLASANVMAQPITVEPLPGLKQAVSNNAVTLVESEDGVYLFSFLGLGSGKTWQDISAAAYVLKPGETAWEELGWAEPVPGEAGRLAASAVSVDDAAWLFNWARVGTVVYVHP
jgi:hypothetical protein